MQQIHLPADRIGQRRPRRAHDQDVAVPERRVLLEGRQQARRAALDGVDRDIGEAREKAAGGFEPVQGPVADHIDLGKELPAGAGDRFLAGAAFRQQAADDQQRGRPGRAGPPPDPVS